MADPDSIVIFRRPPRPVQRRPLEQFALRLCREVARGRSFLCLITDDRELRRLNRRFLGKDWPTDVLSFPAPARSAAAPLPGQPGLGEIAISAQRAARQARRLRHSRDAELRILMLHGLLHLLGMDHSRDRGRMARAEARWRRKLGLPAGLTERVRI